MTRGAYILLFLLLLPGCRCDGTGVDPVELGFRVAPESQDIDFGRVLEGEVAQRPLLLLAETRAAVDVKLTVEAPFAVPAAVQVPGGGQVEVAVRFTAGVGPAASEVVLAVGDKSARVTVHGVGVRPLQCLPSAVCRVSVYDLASDTCIESQEVDDTPCDVANECLEQGRCRAGLCQGVARTCQDNNACTVDGCALGVGCVATPRVCPTPANPCRVATCDPSTGCGEGDALDGTLCGTIDCITAHLCISGSCNALQTPDGFECGAAVACFGPATCQNQVCTRPDAGVWLPEWSATLVGTFDDARPALLPAAGNVFFTACGLKARPPGVDGGVDGGIDGGVDGGGADSGVDGGGADAGEDAGVDGGSVPAGDGGTCALVSYTSSGFDRFAASFADGGPRRLVSAGPDGVVLFDGVGHELRSATTGALLSVSGVVADQPVATLGDGGRLLVTYRGMPGAVVMTWTDAGVSQLVALTAEPARIALDEDDRLHAYDAINGWLERHQRFEDGGSEVRLLRLDGGLDSLVTAGEVVLAGGTQLVQHLADGGASLTVLDFSDAGAGLELQAREVLLSPDTALLFYRRCPVAVSSCLPLEKGMWARAVQSRTGVLRWETQVLPAGVETTLVETALLGLLPGAVATLVRADFDAGTQAYLQVFGEGTRVLLCPLREESARVRAGLFANGRLFVVTDWTDGGQRLEAYPMTGLPLLQRGWPQADAWGGLRRALP